MITLYEKSIGVSVFYVDHLIILNSLLSFFIYNIIIASLVIMRNYKVHQVIKKSSDEYRNSEICPGTYSKCSSSNGYN